MTKTKVTAIVPVYNEEKTVRQVVQILLDNPLIDEVICVNDGSTDNSLGILQKFGRLIKLINLKQNKGKGHALAVSIKQARGEIVVFFDADLVNLSHKHIKTLVKPLLDKQVRIVLGYPTGGFWADAFSDLTGERTYYRQDLLPYLKKMKKTRFGVEVFLNRLFNTEETLKIPLTNLRGLYKHEKYDLNDAFREFIVEVIEVAREIGKSKGLLSSDSKLLAQLSQVKNIKQLRLKTKKITSHHLRRFLEVYFSKSLKKSLFKVKDKQS